MKTFHFKHAIRIRKIPLARSLARSRAEKIKEKQFLILIAATSSNSSNESGVASVSSTPLICGRTPANSILSRWRLCVEMFGQAFLEDVGCEPSSVLNELGRFDVKETKFRREMERLRNSTQRDLTLEVTFFLEHACFG